MEAQIALQKLMHQQFQELKSRNSQYSMRAFARKLKMNSGALSTILNGRRQVSASMASKILQRMTVDPSTSNEIESLFAVKKLLKTKAPEAKKVLQLKSDQFQMIADGVHFSLLCLMETASFRSDVAWMATRLEETPQKIQAALDRLIRLGFVKVDARKNLILEDIQLVTSDGIRELAIQRFHHDRLLEAQTKIEQIDLEDRDLYSSTFAVKKSQLPKARKLIREFSQQMQTLLEVKGKDEVYRFNMQLIPITSMSQKKEKS